MSRGLKGLVIKTTLLMREGEEEKEYSEPPLAPKEFYLEEEEFSTKPEESADLDH